jgi:hypothetical protein
LGAAARFASFMLDLKPGYNLIRLILWTIRADGLRHCERSEAIHSDKVQSGLLRRFAPRNDGGKAKE